MNNWKNQHGKTPLPKQKPLSLQWKETPLPAKIGLIIGGLALIGALLPDTRTHTTTTTLSDPCSWAKRGDMTRESCEGIGRAQAQLFKEQMAQPKFDRWRLENFRP